MKKITVILGSGATCGSGYFIRTKNNNILRPPIDKHFLDTVGSVGTPSVISNSTNMNMDSTAKSSFEYFRRMFPTYGIGMEEFWNTIIMCREYIDNESISFNKSEVRKIFGKSIINPTVGANNSPGVQICLNADRYMRSLVQYVYGEMINDTPNNNEDMYVKLFDTLKINSKNNVVSFLTFNYDLTLEKSLNKSKIDFVYPNFTDNSGDKGVRIYKLHGSLNWWHGYDGYIRLKERVLSPIATSENNYWSEGKFDSWYYYQPAIIPADFMKEEFHHPEGQTRLHSHFMDIWNKAGKSLSDAEVVIIIGYSFPAADPHARWLVRAASRGLFGAHKSKKVFVIDKEEDEKKHKKDRIKYLVCSLFNCITRDVKVCLDGFSVASLKKIHL